MTTNRPIRSRFHLLLGILAILALFAAACSDDSDDSDDTVTDDSGDTGDTGDTGDDTSDGDDASGDADDSEDSGEADDSDDSDASADETGDSGEAGDESGEDEVAAPTGEPIKLMAILDEDESVGFTNDAVRLGLAASVEAVNGRGGVADRPIEVEICATGFQAQKAEECARQAVDGDYLALVASTHNHGDVINPIFEEAGMASFGVLPITIGDFTSPAAFPLSAGSVTTGGAFALAADVLRATTIKAGLLDVPGAEQSLAFGAMVLGPRGLEIADSVVLPRAKPDLSAEAAQLADGADVMVPSIDPATFVRFMDTLAQQGNTVPVAMSAAGAPDSALRELGDAAEGTYVAAGLATNDMEGEWIEQAVSELRAVDPDGSTGDQAKNAWLSVTLLAEFLGELDTIDRASLLEALNSASEVDTRGLTPILDFSTPSTAVGGIIPRLFNPTVVYAQWVDGEVNAIDGTFVDPFAAP